jgi:hypothetical protein
MANRSGLRDLSSLLGLMLVALAGRQAAAQSLRATSAVPGEVVLGGFSWDDLWRLDCAVQTQIVAGTGGPYVDTPPAGDFSYVAGVGSPSSNAAFRVQRGFPVVPGFGNTYLVSWPAFVGVEDVADSSALGDHCVGDANGPPVGDGSYDSDDAICWLWEGWRTDALNSAFTISYFDDFSCLWTSRFAVVLASGTRFGGTPFDLGVARAYMITVAGAGSLNPGELIGSHDPSFPGAVIGSNTCGIDLIPLRYDSLFKTADEILCGLEGPDWSDADGDGQPDTCPNGIFDDVPGTLITITSFDNDPGSRPETDNLWFGRSVARLGSTLVFAGADFGLAPGHGYLVSWSQGQVPRAYFQPGSGGALVSCP